MAVAAGATMAHALLERLDAEGKLDEGLRYEIVNGELVIRGAPLVRHERAVTALSMRLANWAARHGGEVFTGVAVAVGPHQLVPDVTFVGPDRAGQVDVDGFHAPPDLVVEVTSPGTRSLDVNEKRDVYAEIGVAEYWVVDLARDVVVVHRLTDARTYAGTEHTEGTLTTPAAPGVDVPLPELLARR